MHNSQSDLPRITKQHVIDEEAQHIFKTHFNKRNGFIVRQLPEDYGLDYLIELINAQGQASAISFFVQLKGTKNPNIIKTAISISIKKTTLNLFSKQLYPTFLIVIDVTKRLGYWQNCFDLLDELNQRKANWRNDPQKTTAVYIPIENDFSETKLQILKQYVSSVYARRSAILQGPLVMMQPSNSKMFPYKIEDLSKLIHSHEYESFFERISEDPFYYISDTVFSSLFDLFEQIPPKEIYKYPSAMAILGITTLKKGYHQDSKKWLQYAINGKINNAHLFFYSKFFLYEIKYLYGQISEEEFAATLERAKESFPLELTPVISLRQLRLAFYQKENESRKYGRFRQIDLVRDSIEALWEFFSSCDDGAKELIILEIVGLYSVLIPALWGEISTRMLMRNKVNLELETNELLSLQMDAQKATNEAFKTYDLLLNESKNSQMQLSTKAEGLLSYSILHYHLHTTGLHYLIFSNDKAPIPEKIPLSENDRALIMKAFEYCSKAMEIFKEIGSRDRETTALIYIMGYYEDLGMSAEYEEAKDKIEKLIEITLTPNNLVLFNKSKEEGSFRQQIINGIRKRPSDDDFRKAQMSETEIEMQVECNCKTFNIIEKERINNVRLDLESYKKAARFRVNICKHFELLQDIRHTFSLTTLYTIDPNRKGICKFLKYESNFTTSNVDFIITFFRGTYCDKCELREPLNHSC